jgi:hypothetical protein
MDDFLKFFSFTNIVFIVWFIVQTSTNNILLVVEFKCIVLYICQTIGCNIMIRFWTVIEVEIFGTLI